MTLLFDDLAGRAVCQYSELKMIEDFTHVLPEDSPAPAQKPKWFSNQVFDLIQANEQAKYYQAFREQIAQIERQARQTVKEKYSLK